MINFTRHLKDNFTFFVYESEFKLAKIKRVQVSILSDGRYGIFVKYVAGSGSEKLDFMTYDYALATKYATRFILWKEEPQCIDLDCEFSKGNFTYKIPYMFHDTLVSVTIKQLNETYTVLWESGNVELNVKIFKSFEEAIDSIKSILKSESKIFILNQVI